jgi:hypothetical protein
MKTYLLETLHEPSEIEHKNNDFGMEKIFLSKGASSETRATLYQKGILHLDARCKTLRNSPKSQRCEMGTARIQTK